MSNVKILKFFFIIMIILEIIFLTIYPFFLIRPILLWFTIPFVFLTGLFAVFYETILYAMAFLTINFAPIIFSLCNIFEFDYYMGFYDKDLKKLNEKIRDYLNDNSYKKGEFERDEFNKIASRYYKSQQMPVVIVLAIFQVVFIVLCILLLKIGSWKWIKNLDARPDVDRRTYIIYQLERILFLITISFLGIWILMSEISKIFDLNYMDFNLPSDILEIFFNTLAIIIIIPILIVFVVIRKCSTIRYVLYYIVILFEIGIIITRLYYFQLYYYDGATLGDVILYSFNNNIIFRERLIIAIPTVFFLLLLLFNTILCQRRVDKEFILQIYGSENDQFLLEGFKKMLKEIFEKFSNFLEKKPEPDEKLDAKAWKFEPELKYLQLKRILIGKETASVENAENNDSKTEANNFDYLNVKFNAKSDIMMQTNYPLCNIHDVPDDFEKWFYYYEITILSNGNHKDNKDNKDETIIVIGDNEDNEDKTIIAIGLAPKYHPTNKLPGCDTNSVGFFSDGKIFCNQGYTSSDVKVSWGEVNDVIGCGYYPKTRQVFFTKDGENLGIVYTNLFPYEWFPTIGSNGKCSLKVNFGQEIFKYKEANDGTSVAMSVAGIISQDILEKFEDKKDQSPSNP